MIKSTIVKWAVAAALAVPAVPLFAKTVHHRYVTRTQTHRTLAVRPHRVTTTHHRITPLVHSRKLTATRHLTTAHHLTTTKHHVVRSTSLRHTAARTSATHFKVHITKMPPTIDGINA
jgi:hypothetical protein